MWVRRRSLVLTCVLATTTPAAADDHVAPDGVTESCQLLVPFPFLPPDVTSYQGKTYYRHEDFEDIEALCEMDFHDNVGVCPKIHGTQPGLEIYDLSTTKLDKKQFEAARCKIPGRLHGSKGKPRGAIKAAKFKTAVFSSEAESMLFYFHFSRLLGNLGHVQPAAWRTVSARAYRGWANDAIKRFAALKQQPVFSTLDGWEIVDNLLDPRVKPRPRIVASRRRMMIDATLAWGAIVENPRGERERLALCGGRTPLAKPQGFRAMRFYRLVDSRKPLSEHHFDAQLLACARDYTDMIILDHVFNQIDRMGNIHQKTYYHSIDDQGRLTWSAKETPGAVPLRRLVMKDNDDGLKWKIRSIISAIGLVDEIRHLDPTVYARVQWLAGLMTDPTTNDAVKRWFVQSVHVSEGHYEVVRGRFLEVAAKFKKKHDSGQLHLDLDLAAAVQDVSRRPPSGPRSASAAPPAR